MFAQAALHIAWNLFLAALAVALAHALAGVVRLHRTRTNAWSLAALVLVLAAWLLVLPNTCYLFTEVRHLFDAIEDQDLWSRAHVSLHAQAWLAIRSVVLAIYAGAGALTFGLAIRPVREAVESGGVRTRAILPLFFCVVSLGVYLGLVQRLNSWDVVTCPDRVLTNAIDGLSAPRRLLGVVLGGGVLWTVYEIVDVWIDGAKLRLARLSPSR